MIFFPVVNLSLDDEYPQAGSPTASEDAEDLSSPNWRSSLPLPSSQDGTRSMAPTATTVSSPRPSVVFSTEDEGYSSPLQRFQDKVSRALKGYSQKSERSRLTYNPEILTSQKRQWANFQLQSLDHCSPEEPSKLFENMVVVGVHPSCDVPTLRKLVMAKKSEASGRLRYALSSRNHSRLEEHSFEPQVLFAFPPEKQLPLKYRDLLSFCFPGGIEVHAVEKNSSMSELNEILLGQDHLRQSELSFVFRLQVTDSSPLYGCCVLMEELVDKPSRLISMMSEKQTVKSGLERYIFTTKRCYCILSRLPFFDLHFGVLNRIFMEERLERLTRSISILDLELTDTATKVEGLEENDTSSSLEHIPKDDESGNSGNSQSRFSEATASVGFADIGSPVIHSDIEGSSSSSAQQNSETNNTDKECSAMKRPTIERCLSDVCQQLLQKSYEPSSSFQGPPFETRYLRSDNDEADTEEASTSGQEFLISHSDLLEWAKENNHGSVQIICEYYKLNCPPRGSTITFHPLEHMLPLEFHRPAEKLPHISDSSLDQISCKTSLEKAEVLNALVAEEEATTLSAWGISCICSSLRLEHVLTLLVGALLEKQIVFVCSNLGILCASVLSLIPLIRPYQWQSLLMPILPNDMLDFLDAPVPFIVGIQKKTSEVQSKLTNAILVDLSKNQVRSASMPQLPRYKELLTALAPYHSKLVGEGYRGTTQLIAECTDEQVEAANGFMEVLKNYLDSLCSNLRSHTITNVQSNDDKVSLILKESFIDSFSSQDRPFMKCFVDTQLFSVHTDLVLSLYQKED